MDDAISISAVEDIQLAASKLTGFERRQFQAAMAMKYCNGSARLTETRFGWYRDTVAKALEEQRTGVRCLDRFGARGRKRTEDQNPQLREAIVVLAESQSQADPKFQTTLAYTRITAQAGRDELLNDPKLAPLVPCRETIGGILNRLGYRIRPVKKTDPQKKSQKLTTSSPTSARAAK